MKLPYHRLLAVALQSFIAVGVAHAEWIPIPLITATQRANGVTGGEGCQVIEQLACDSSGDVLIAITDVGGAFRSRDGAANWEPINIGLHSRGGTAVAIDPRNANRVLIAGGSGGPTAQSANGLYLSTNQGDTWTKVFNDPNNTDKQNRDQFAYDPNSYSAALGYTQTIYWSSPTSATGRLLRSTDGGSTWNPVTSVFPLNTTTKLNDAILKFDANGVLYAGHSTGLYKSTDAGANFSQIATGSIASLDVVGTVVYYGTTSTLYKSDATGGNFTTLAAAGLPAGNRRTLKVSPVDPLRMSINQNPDGDNPLWYSTDGGATFARSTNNNTNSFIPPNGNQRGRIGVWHPTVATTVYGYGWGILVKSTNGGQNVAWSNNGNLGVMHTGRFAFNPHNPDVVLFTTQDYNSAVTGDGGNTFRYLGVNTADLGNWGGYNYGGYAFSTGTAGRMFVARSDGGWGGARTLSISMNGGGTWTRLKDAAGNYITGNYADTAMGDPADPNVAYWHQWRTTNGMATGTTADWSQMTNCTAVYTYDPVSKAVFGRGGTSTDLVRSTDKGASWQKIADLPAAIWDIAYDHVRNRLYVTTKDARKLYQIDLDYSANEIEITSRLPADQFGNRGAETVAVDPQNPEVVYAGNHKDIYMTSAAVMRSVDGGITWTNLTKQAGDTGLDGGREAQNVRVHPATGMLWVGGQCFGTYAYAPPEYSSRFFEAEDLTVANQSGANATVAAFSAANTGRWMDFGTTAAGSYVTLALPNLEATTYKLSYLYRKFGNPGGPGVFQVSVSESPTSGFVNLGGTTNFYDATPKFAIATPGEVTFATPGTKYIRFTCTGRSGGEGFNGKVDAISLVSYVQKPAPDGDAYVRDGSATTAFGATDPTALVVKKDLSGWNRQAFLRFTVAPSGPVQSAKVRLHGQHDPGSIDPTVSIFPVSDTAWNEATITWNAQPAGIGSTALDTKTVTATSQYREWDVTAYVQQQVAAGNRKVSFMLRSNVTASAEVIRFNSKEAAANPPVLEVKTAW